MTLPIDHLVFATRDLRASTDHLQELLGVRAVAGGSHPGMGTRNALISLGPGCYLEIIGPDPGQPDYEGERIFGIDSVQQARLASWCIRVGDIDRFIEDLRQAGVATSDALPMSRRSPDGDQLEWRLAFLADAAAIKELPFFIDWGSSRHPSADCPSGATLAGFEVHHPQAETLRTVADALDIHVSIQSAKEPVFKAFIRCPRGEIELT